MSCCSLPRRGSRVRIPSPAPVFWIDGSARLCDHCGSWRPAILSAVLLPGCEWVSTGRLVHRPSRGNEKPGPHGPGFLLRGCGLAGYGRKPGHLQRGHHHQPRRIARPNGSSRVSAQRWCTPRRSSHAFGQRLCLALVWPQRLQVMFRPGSRRRIASTPARGCCRGASVRAPTSICPGWEGTSGTTGSAPALLAGSSCCGGSCCPPFTGAWLAGGPLAKRAVWVAAGAVHAGEL